MREVHIVRIGYCLAQDRIDTLVRNLSVVRSSSFSLVGSGISQYLIIILLVRLVLLLAPVRSMARHDLALIPSTQVGFLPQGIVGMGYSCIMGCHLDDFTP